MRLKQAHFLNHPARGAMIVAIAPQARQWQEEMSLRQIERATGSDLTNVKLSPLDKPIVGKVQIGKPA